MKAKLWGAVLLLVLAGWLHASPAAAAIGFVQAAGNSTGGSSGTQVTTTLTGTTAGNTGVVVAVTVNGTTVSSVTDNATGGSSTYSFVTAINNGGTRRVEIWSTAAGGLRAGATSLTVNISNTTQLVVEFMEVSGVASLGNTATNIGSSSSATISVTTQDNNNWVVGGFGAQGSSTLSTAGANTTIQHRDNTVTSPPSSKTQAAIANNTTPGSPGAVTLTVNMSSSQAWEAAALELRTACPTVADASYVAATAGNGASSAPVTVYWSSSLPVLVLRKTSAFSTEAPTSGTTYTAGQTGGSLGTATVAYAGTVVAPSFTETLSNGTYYYKVFANSSGCYSPGSPSAGVVARPAGGTNSPTWSYALAGGSILKGGTAGTGTLYATSNASRIVGLNTSDGTQSWAPVATNAPIQGWLTWLPVGSAAGSGQSSVLGADLPLAANTARVYLADVTAGSTSWPVLPSLPPTGWNSTGLPGADQFLAAPAAQMGAYSNATFQAAQPGGISFAAVAKANAGAVSSLTYALTIPAGGTNRFLLVSVGLGTSCTGPTPTISGITYAGVPLTQITSIVGTPCGNTQTRSEQWGLVAPATGTNNVVVTLSAAGTTIHSGAMAFTGVNQTTPVRAFASASGAGTSSTVTVTSAVGDLVVNTVGQGTSITAPGSGQTQRYLNNVSSSNTLDNDAGSTAPGAAPSVTMTWTFGASDQWQTISSSLQPSGADSVIFAATANTLTYNAVGPTKNNQVFALGASTGAVLWTFSPGTMDGVQGMPWVDYARNRIYVTSCDGSVDCKSGTQQTLWVIKTVTDAEGTQGQAMSCLVCTTPKGINGSPTLSIDGLTLYIGDQAGTLYAINAGTRTLKWSLALTPAGTTITGFVWENPSSLGTLYFAASDGTARCILDNGGSGSACAGWSNPSVPGPSTPLLLGSKLFMGSWDGTTGQIYQINLSTGAIEVGPPPASKQVKVGDGTKQPGDVSTETGNEILVGTTEGVIYKFPLTGGSL